MPNTATRPRLLYRDMRTRAEEIADEIIKERVIAGIALLNEKYGPDWVDHVDPASLVMSMASSCVLGQVYNDYFDGLHKLSLTEDGDSQRYGFYLTDVDEHSYGELDEAWKLVLANA